MMINDSRASVKHATSHFGIFIPETLLDEEIEEWDRRLLAEGRCEVLQRLCYREPRLPRIRTTEGALIGNALVIAQCCDSEDS
jgi:hypothetical protein